MTAPRNPWQYPQHPQYPQPAGYPLAPQNGVAYAQGGFPRPATVNAAFWIAVIVPIVPIVATVLVAANFLFYPALVDQALGTGSDDPEAHSIAASFTTIMLVASIVFYSLLTVLWVWFGFKMRSGAQWARVALTVFACLWLLSAVIGLVYAVAGGDGALSSAFFEGLSTSNRAVHVPPGLTALKVMQHCLGLLSMAAFLVLVFVRPSNWYFHARRFR